MKGEWENIRNTIYGAGCGAIGAGLAIPIVAGWDRMWTYESGQVWAAWLQAVGSVAAICAALWVAWRDRRDRIQSGTDMAAGFAAAIFNLVIAVKDSANRCAMLLERSESLRNQVEQAQYLMQRHAAFAALQNNLSAMERVGVPLLAAAVQGGQSGFRSTAHFIAKCTSQLSSINYNFPLLAESNVGGIWEPYPQLRIDLRSLVILWGEVDRELRVVLGWPLEEKYDC